MPSSKSSKKKGGGSSQALISRFFTPAPRVRQNEEGSGGTPSPSAAAARRGIARESQTRPRSESRPSGDDAHEVESQKLSAAPVSQEPSPAPSARRTACVDSKRVLPSKRRGKEVEGGIRSVERKRGPIEIDSDGDCTPEEDDQDADFVLEDAVTAAAEASDDDRYENSEATPDSNGEGDDDEVIIRRKPAKRRRLVPTADDGDDSDVIAMDCDDDAGADRDGEVVEASSGESGGGLAEYRADSSATVNRDEKRRRRFEAKVGRLGENRWFTRTTGGDGGGGEQDAVPSQYVFGGRGAPTVKGKVKYTPLEQQFVDIKRKNPNTLLMVECGYKWQFFGEDALVASKVCRIYSGIKQNFTVSSVPDVTMSRHVSRLVQAGHKVGLVRQIDTAALKRVSEKASGPFRRELCEVYTRGTVFADGELGEVGTGGGLGAASHAAYIAAFVEIESTQGESTTGSDSVAGKRSEVRIALVAVDTATGDVVFDEFADDAMRSELDSRLITLEPVEVVVREGELSGTTERALAHFCSSANARLDRVCDDAFEIGEGAHIGGQDGKYASLRDVVAAACRTREKDVGRKGCSNTQALVLACARGLSVYLRQFRLERAIGDVREFRAFSVQREMHLGADVMRNFELFRNSNDGSVKGSLLCLIDRTRTAFGSRRMKQWLAHPLTVSSAIRDRLDAVEVLRQLVDGAFEAGGGVQGSLTVDSSLCDVLSALGRCPDLERGLARISYEKCAPARFFEIVSAFAVIGESLQRLKLALENRNGPKEKSLSLTSPLLTRMIESVPNITGELDRLVFQRLSAAAAKENDYRHLFRELEASDKELKSDPLEEKFMGSVVNVNHLLEALRECESDLDVLLVDLRKRYKRPSWEWKKVAQDEYLLEVPVKASSSVPKDWMVVNTTKAVKRFRPPQAVELLQSLEEARERCDEAATQAWRAFLALFSSTCAQLQAVVRFLCELDCLCSHARTSLLPGYVKPIILDSGAHRAGIRVNGGRHPMAEALLGVSYVPNDVCLGLPSKGDTGPKAVERCKVITGPNMGGKSSYIRMTALLAIMAQIGVYVPADAAEVSPFDAMFCRMGAVDMIGKGMSTLMVELAETSRILEEATDRSLIILDELGRGTATHDGTAIASATLEHFVRSSSSVVLFVTHFPSIAQSAVLSDVVGAYFMDYVEEEDGHCGDDALGRRKKISFLYKITRGVAQRSYGLNVAKLAGLPDAVLRMAAIQAASFGENQK